MMPRRCPPGGARRRARRDRRLRGAYRTVADRKISSLAAQTKAIPSLGQIKRFGTGTETPSGGGFRKLLQIIEIRLKS